MKRSIVASMANCNGIIIHTNKERHAEMEKTGDHADRNTTIVNPLNRLHWAWEASLPDDEWASATIQLFHTEVSRILDQTQLTQAWYVPGSGDDDDHINQLRIKAFKTESPLSYVKAFRRQFWNRNAAALLRASIDHGTPFLGEAFWHHVFPDMWLTDTSSPPPLSPSLHVPADIYSSVYARNEEYRHWVDGNYRQRLAGLNPAFHRAALDCPYDPDDKAAFEWHARILTGASVLVMAEWLGLNEEQGDKLASRLDVNTDTQFRARKERHILWPTNHRRPYVDLWLDPILAQMLMYQTGDWNGPLVLRSLSLKDNESYGYRPLFLLLLNRIDIEMAVWCEVLRRLLDGTSPAETDPPQPLPDKDMEAPRHDTQKAMNAFDRLLPYQVPLAEAILRATRDMALPPTGATRFALSDHLPLGLDLEGAGTPVANGIFLLSPEVTTPVLEDGIFFCQLDWQRIAPEGDWMDIRLFVLPADGGPAEYLEYEEIEAEDDTDDSPVSLRLRGDTWDRLATGQSATTLAAAFGRAVFGVRPSRLGTGAFVLGVIDLNQRRPS